jgi:hypothetical protein
MITTKDQAMDWFLGHSSGSVTVQNAKGETKECETYPEAVEFLNL